MIRAILIGASPVPGAGKILKSLKPTARDLKIGVDGGLDTWFKAGCIPDFAVGDFDSLKNSKVLATLMHIRLPEKKDRSDLYYAAQAAIHLGATDLVCLGVSGGRADHHLAVLLDLSQMSDYARITVLDPKNEYAFVSRGNGPWRRKLKRAAPLSVLAPAGAKGVTLIGLKYALSRAPLKPSSHGLSNVANGGFVTVAVERGRLIIVLTR